MNMEMITLRTLAAPIAWGTTYLAVTELLAGQSPLLVAAGRVAPAAMLLLVVARRTDWWRPVGREWSRTAALALANFGCFFPLLTVAIQRLPGGVAAAMGGLQPLLVTALAWPVLGERPRPRVLAVGAAAALGVTLVVIGPGATFDPLGAAAALGANVSFAAGVVLTRRSGPPAHRIAAAGWQLVVASAVLVPLALVVDGAPTPPTTMTVLGYLYLSVVATGGAFLLWFHGIARLPVAAPPLLGLAAPVTGAALGWIVLGQSLSPVQILGFVVTVGAIAHGATSAARITPVSPGEGSFRIPRPDSQAPGTAACRKMDHTTWCGATADHPHQGALT